MSNSARARRTSRCRNNAIVRVVPRAGGVRQVDRTIAEIAAANGGRYDIDVTSQTRPVRDRGFRRNPCPAIGGDAPGSCAASSESPTAPGSSLADHLDKAAAFEARQRRDRPVTIETLSAVSLDRLPHSDAATWLDKELMADEPEPVRDAGFGREVRAAQALRRQWLIDEQLADEQDGRINYRPGTIAALQRRELLRVAGQLSNELSLPFVETKSGDHVDGRFSRAIEIASGRHALIERSRDFTLVPWRPVLERQVGKSVSGIMRRDGINWTIGRGRGGPSIG